MSIRGKILQTFSQLYDTNELEIEKKKSFSLSYFIYVIQKFVIYKRKKFFISSTMYQYGFFISSFFVSFVYINIIHFENTSKSVLNMTMCNFVTCFEGFCSYLSTMHVFIFSSEKYYIDVRIIWRKSVLENHKQSHKIIYTFLLKTIHFDFSFILY